MAAEDEELTDVSLGHGCLAARGFRPPDYSSQRSKMYLLVREGILNWRKHEKKFADVFSGRWCVRECISSSFPSSHSIWNLMFFSGLSNPLTQGHSSVMLMFLKVPSSENTNMNKLDSGERVFI